MKISIKYVIPLIIAVGLTASYTSSRAALVEGSENHTECQYPTRPLVDGHCDNMEPAVVPSEIPTPTTVPVLLPEQKTNTCK